MIPVLDVDGNGTVGVFSDGLLILRYMNGVRGDQLINGVVAPGATRTTAPQIEGYIRKIWELLDADGNGQVKLESDGFLILLYLVGLTGTNLTQNGRIIEPGASRATAESISAYLLKLKTNGFTL